MMPWLRDALTLGTACRSLRLVADAKGVWRPAAAPSDVERAFALIAETLASDEHDAFADRKRVEETERLRLAVQALTTLALSKNIDEEEIAALLRWFLIDMPMTGPEVDPPPACRLAPTWARARARRRVMRAAAAATWPPEAITPPLTPPDPGGGAEALGEAPRP